MNKRTQPVFLILLMIISLQGFSQESFSGSGITVGGTNEWYWRMYRQGSGELNETLIFADKRNMGESETIKMILSKEGEINIRSFKTGGFNEWYWKIYRQASGPLNESLIFASKRYPTD